MSVTINLSEQTKNKSIENVITVAEEAIAIAESMLAKLQEDPSRAPIILVQAMGPIFALQDQSEDWAREIIAEYVMFNRERIAKAARSRRKGAKKPAAKRGRPRKAKP